MFRLSVRYLLNSTVNLPVRPSLNNFQQKLAYSMADNQRRKVYVTRTGIPPVALELLAEKCDVTVWEQAGPMPREQLLKHIVRNHALFCSLTEKIDAELLEKAGPQLKVVATMSVGFEHIDLQSCKQKGIRVGYTPGVLTDATAELTMALLLATNRRLFEANKEVYNGGWKAWSPTWMCGQGLKGLRIGLFGFGRIGQEIAKRLVPFKPSAITYTTRTERAKEAAAVGATKVSADEMLCASDVIIVCSASTPETINFFNEAAFGKMKKNAIFINTARGNIVNQTALYNALKNNCIWAAGLDVMTPEPLPLSDPLLKLSNVVLLPHIGSADIKTRDEMAQLTACNILAALEGGEMPAEVPL